MRTTGSRRVLALALAALVMSGCATGPDYATDHGARLELARTDIRHGRHREAKRKLESLRGALESTDDRIEHARLQGECCQALGDYQEAGEAWFRCLTLDAEGRHAYRAHMGLARANEGMTRWGTAERHLDAALESARTPRDQDAARLVRARVALAQGDRATAARQLDRIRDRSLFGYDELRARAGSGERPTARKVPREERRARRRAEDLGTLVRKRKDWGAKPPVTKRMVRLGRAYRITVHHSGERAARPAPRGLDAARRQMRAYQSAHQVGASWGDIGYHYVIDGAGRIWEGRALRWQGAHGGNGAANRGNIGVCVMGNSNVTEPTADQKASLKLLLVHLMAEHRIPASQIKGHNDVRKEHGLGGTACPGKKLARYLDRLVQEL